MFVNGSFHSKKTVWYIFGPPSELDVWRILPEIFRNIQTVCRQRKVYSRETRYLLSLLKTILTWMTNWRDTSGSHMHHVHSTGTDWRSLTFHGNVPINGYFLDFVFLSLISGSFIRVFRFSWKTGFGAVWKKIHTTRTIRNVHI